MTLQPLLGHPREDLDADAVAAALALTSPQIRHGYDVLDLSDVETGETLPVDEDTGGDVTWSYRPPDPTAAQEAKVTEVRRRATITLAGDVSVNLYARRIRLWSEIRLADGDWARFHQGVFVFPNHPRADDGNVVRRTITLFDKSHDWMTTTLTATLAVESGEDVVDWVKTSLTAEFGETVFAIATSTATLDQDMVFESGTSWLDVYSSLLAAIGYDQLTADENGHPASQPLDVLAAKGYEHTFGAGQGKVVTAGSMEPLLPTLPNVLRFSARQGPGLGNTEGDGQYTVTNQATGPGSIDARGGREVVLTVPVDAADQTTLELIAEAEKQRYFAGGGTRFSGQLGFCPRLGDRDVIRIDLPRLETEGDWLVTSWTLPRKRITEPDAVLVPITAELRVP